MRENRLSDSETVARPASNAYDIKYLAVPIQDKQGKVIGAFEVVTDETMAKWFFQ
jgi:DNA-binding IclR family transcriptional regulator